MRIVFNWHNLEKNYPDPNKIIILKTILQGPPLDILYRIGTIEIGENSIHLLFTGQILDTNNLSLNHTTDVILFNRTLKYYEWDYYLTKWEELDAADNISELLDIS